MNNLVVAYLRIRYIYNNSYACLIARHATSLQ